MNDNKLDSKNIGSIKENDNEIVITIPKRKNYTIEDLKQKLINKLHESNNLKIYENEIELLDVILRNDY